MFPEAARVKTSAALHAAQKLPVWDQHAPTPTRGETYSKQNVLPGAHLRSTLGYAGAASDVARYDSIVIRKPRRSICATLVARLREEVITQPRGDSGYLSLDFFSGLSWLPAESRGVCGLSCSSVLSQPRPLDPG